MVVVDASIVVMPIFGFIVGAIFLFVLYPEAKLKGLLVIAWLMYSLIIVGVVHNSLDSSDFEDFKETVVNSKELSIVGCDSFDYVEFIRDLDSVYLSPPYKTSRCNAGRKLVIDGVNTYEVQYCFDDDFGNYHYITRGSSDIGAYKVPDSFCVYTERVNVDTKKRTNEH